MRGTPDGTTSRPNGRGGRKILRYIAAAVAALALAVAGVVTTAIPALAWEGGGSASATCVSGTAVIAGTYHNGETAPDKSTDVTMTYGSLSDGPKTVAPGADGTFSINTGQQSLAAGTVTFELTWTNGADGTDSMTASFDAINCTPPVTPVAPTAPTAVPGDCDDFKKVVTPPTGTDAIYNPSGVTELAPGESVTYTATPGTIPFPSDAVTSWSFTNDLNVEDCDTTPPSVGSYNGSVSGTCKVGTGTGYVDKGFGSSVTFTLKVGHKGQQKWATTSWTVAPGSQQSKTLPGNPGDQVLLFAKGKLLSAAVMKKDCGTPPTPVCQHDCNPTPPTPNPECPPNNTWFDSNHNNVVDAGECVPTARAETGLADDISNRSTGLLEGSALVMAALALSLFLVRRPDLLSRLKRR